MGRRRRESESESERGERQQRSSNTGWWAHGCRLRGCERTTSQLLPSCRRRHLRYTPPLPSATLNASAHVGMSRRATQRGSCSTIVGIGDQSVAEAHTTSSSSRSPQKLKPPTASSVMATSLGTSIAGEPLVWSIVGSTFQHCHAPAPLLAQV